MPALHLRWIVSTTAILSTVITLAAIAALVGFTTKMRQAADHLRQAADAAHATEALKVDLLSYGRLSTLFLTTHEEEYQIDRERMERDIQIWFEKATAITLERRQGELFAEARDKIDRYLSIRKTAEAQVADPDEILRLSTESLKSALASLDQLGNISTDRVTRLQQSEAYWDHLGNLVAIAVAALLLIDLIVVMIGAQRLIYHPLRTVASTITQFASGERDVRLPPQRITEIQNIAHAFNEMADRLAILQKERLRFLAGVAHDLRNPLTAMKAATALLESQNGKELSNEKLQQSLGILSRQVLRLERMVGDFLDTTRIQSGDLELRLGQYDLRNLARETVEMWQSVSSDHQLNLSLPDTPVEILCDPTRIEQVLSNVLSNAIKYSPEGGNIDVSVSTDTGNAMIAVKDPGMGIPTEDIKRIFEPFRRTIVTRDLIPGIGLGLSVSLRIIKAHGGDIEVESEPGRGSTFRITLPTIHSGIKAA